MNIRDFSRHIGLTDPWLKNPAYGPGSNCNVLVFYDIVSDEQEIERSSYLFTYASLAAPVNQINVFVMVTSPDNIVTSNLKMSVNMPMKYNKYTVKSSVKPRLLNEFPSGYSGINLLNLLSVTKKPCLLIRLFNSLKFGLEVCVFQTCLK